MASNRHLGRIIALQTLYELIFRKECGDKINVDDVIERNISRYKASLDDVDFIKELVRNVEKHSEELDKKIQPLAPEWPLAQIARVDHIVLRMGSYELIYQENTPPRVVINEAVELAKAFGGDNSSKFVNGVLGTLLRQIHPDKAAEVEADSKKEEA
jgi:transcription antitermination protein NusB